MKITCICSVLLFFFACQPREYKEFKNFPKEVFLESEIINTPEVFRMPLELLILNEAIVAVDFKSDHFFHLFSNPGFTYLGSHVRRGRGPGEELFVNPFIRKTSGESFFYQTINKVNKVYFSPEHQELQIVESIELPQSYFEFGNAFKIHEYYLGTIGSLEIDTEFIRFCPSEGRLLEFGPEHPCFGRRLTLEQKRQLVGKVVSVKPDENKFASAFLLFPIIRIYNAQNGNLIAETRFENNQQFPEAFISTSSTKHESGLIMNNYRAIKSTDNYIYALYVGKMNKDLAYDYSDLSVLGDHSNEIHVFNWEGKPVKRILLDRTIFSFDVTPDDRTLIASSINSLDELFKFTLEWD